MRLIEQGTSVVVYVDGDTGATKPDPGKLIRVPFLGQHTQARRGVARMAHWSGVPLYPTYNFREDPHTISVFNGTPLDSQGHTPEAFEAIAMSAIYGHFSSLLMHYPMQWENWFGLHLNIDHAQRIPPRGKEPDVGLFESGGDYYLLEKRNYRVIPMDILR